MAPQVLQQQVRRSHPGLCSGHRWGGANGASLGPAEASEAGGFFGGAMWTYHQLYDVTWTMYGL